MSLAGRRSKLAVDICRVAISIDTVAPGASVVDLCCIIARRYRYEVKVRFLKNLLVSGQSCATKRSLDVVVHLKEGKRRTKNTQESIIACRRLVGTTIKVSHRRSNDRTYV